MEITPEELKEELKQNKINVIQAYKMTIQHRPLYLVITNKDTSTQELQKTTKFLFNVKIHWQRHYNKKQIIQCKNCQKWGHATANCALQTKCLKCAGSHNVKNCSENPTIKCSNCDQVHPANSIECISYKKLLNNRKRNKNVTSTETSTKEQQNYLPAPAPQFNPWTTQRPPAPSPPTSCRDWPTLPSATRTHRIRIRIQN